MAYQRLPASLIWELAARQHGVVSRSQLIELGMSAQTIKRRLANGRLHQLYRGVYAVGRPEVTRYGRWTAAVLACGPGAALSHRSAGTLWGILAHRVGRIEVSVADRKLRRRPGLVVHRPPSLSATDLTTRRNIPLTSPIRTLVDLGACLQPTALEAAVNEADKQDLVDPETLRARLDSYAGIPGVASLRRLLDKWTFTLTDSELERRFLPIARRAGLPGPATQARLNGFRVDFYWPELGLVVETDGLRYHRTPAQQAKDRIRDQAHAAAGLTPVRFTHAQVRYEPGRVRDTLEAVAERLRAGRKAA